MKIALISDLHLDVSFITVPELEIPKDTDLIIMAGDLHPNDKSRNKYLKSLENIAPVLFIPGNHDYWGSTPADPVCEIVYPEPIIAGTTLWTKLTDTQWELYKWGLNDYRFMYDQTQEKYNETHEREKSFLLGSEADIIVSHHCPTYRSVHPRFAGDALNCCFANDLEADILALREPPKLWIHGHTHEPMDYWVGKTHVICHPRGYPGESQWLGYKARIIET